MSARAELYLPAVANFPDDLAARHNILAKARQRDLITGFMLVLSQKDLAEPDRLKRQLDNLDRYAGMQWLIRPRAFVMHPNMPLDGPQRLNFLDNPEWSEENVAKSIDFAASLPHELTPFTGKTVSFHLNTLVRPDQWVADEDYWQEKFAGVAHRVRNLDMYAASRRVNIAVETVPLPEFGDASKTDQHQLADGTYWADLGNPWPLLFWRDEIVELRAKGAKLAIDICHSALAYKAVEEALKMAAAGKKDQALATYKLREQDLFKIATTARFKDHVLANTQPGDIWHMNDTKGFYQTPELQGQQAYFQEGVSLFEGDIAPQTLRKLLPAGFNSPIKMVLEINETDFVNNPNIKRALDWALVFANHPQA